MDQTRAEETDPHALARALMVDGQIRPNRISDPRILAAMRALPRERFVPPAQSALAYADENVPLGKGRVMPAPLTVARLVQSARPEAGERALVVAANTGYGAALLAACGVSVTALEDDAALAAQARRTLADLSPGVEVLEGRLDEGAPTRGPFDIIIIEGAVRAPPAALLGQLRPGSGRIVIVRKGPGASGHGMGQIVLGEPTRGGLGMRALHDCALPELPALCPAPGFVF